jgi:23S rRNA (uracil1939-C5)-methyltransferase
MIGSLQAKKRIAQIEVAVSDDVTALVFRNLDPLSDVDIARMKDFASEHGLAFFLQPGNQESIVPLWPEQIRLQYSLKKQDISFTFSAADFTQINDDINQAMVERALTLLAPERDDKVLDLFCGLGNFTLPLARQAGTVTGVEGEKRLIDKARLNAEQNDIGNCDFHVANLFESAEGLPWARKQYEKILLDPPRSGAQAIVEDIKRFGADRILYISCHPGSLARDAGILVNEHGYKLVSAGVMDMFPHTAHVESIALFER